MFAGVAASSMPTVHMFLAGRKFSLVSWRPLAKLSFRRLLNISTRENLPEHNANLANLRGRGTAGPENVCETQMTSLSSDDYERKEAKIPQSGDSQIYLTHGISVTRD